MVYGTAILRTVFLPQPYLKKTGAARGGTYSGRMPNSRHRVGAVAPMIRRDLAAGEVLPPPADHCRYAHAQRKRPGEVLRPEVFWNLSKRKDLYAGGIIS